MSSKKCVVKSTQQARCILYSRPPPSVDMDCVGLHHAPNIEGAYYKSNPEIGTFPSEYCFLCVCQFLFNFAIFEYAKLNSIRCLYYTVTTLIINHPLERHFVY